MRSIFMPNPVEDFIAHWSKVPASERATSQSFLNDLCDVLGVDRPEGNEVYQFERPMAVTQHGKHTTKFIDLYKRGCFVLEAKKYDERKAEPDALALLVEEGPELRKNKIVRGTERWDDAMLEAFDQAERYAQHLPTDEPTPIFLVIVDVGHVIELYADFSQKGRNFTHYPDARSHRIPLADLIRTDIRERLRLVWTDPAQLDPSRRTTEVTLEVARHLAALAKSLEDAGNHPKLVADFLCRCLFCMFAEDVGLLTKGSFTAFLESLRGDPHQFVPLMQALFKEMDRGAELSMILRQKLLRFNGGLFAEQTVLAVNCTQLGLLIEAAKCEWRQVEPAIFGTLLEQALEPDERGRLGAHFTPRAYVERLVLPTIMEPLRSDWRAVRDEAVTLANRGDLKRACDKVRTFLDKLCAVRVLDPACGSGNFLYVTLEHMKRLEGEVLDLLRQFGDTATPSATVDPHQFLGLELNGRAVPIAELVLWIGYLQWHFRVHGDVLPAEPVLKKFDNIVERDAVLAYDRRVQITGKMAEANPKLPGLPDNWREKVAKHTDVIFVWDRKSYKTDAVTGREIPDETKQVVLYAYQNPRPAEWPQADFIVGNPPFNGKGEMRADFGDGYVETLRSTYPNLPEGADFVLFWWHKAAEYARASKARCFGLITTSTIRQTFSRRIVDYHLAASPPLSLLFAIPDHPWVDPTATDEKKAAVRIAMTVGSVGARDGELLRAVDEQPQDDGSVSVTFSAMRGRIQADLSIGANVAKAAALQANDLLASTGLILGSRGFVVSATEADELVKKDELAKGLIFPLRNGDDLTGKPRKAFVIDTNGFSEEALRTKCPHVYEHLRRTVYQDRKTNSDPKLRRFWWLFRRSNEQVRGAIASLRRFIATSETSTHRIFVFLDASVKPEHKLVVIGSEDAFHLGVLSSCIHLTYAVAAGGWRGIGNDPVYSKTRCFDPYPFPDCTEKQKDGIRKIAEELDAHRKRAQEQHHLGLTDIYNVLEKLRAGEEFTSKDKVIHDAALVSTLRQLHDDLEKAVADAYGWPWPMTDAEILEHVVALNAARAAEEKAGVIRWLRPEFQAKGELQLEGGSAPKAPRKPTNAPKRKGKAKWPSVLAERIAAVEVALAQAEHPMAAAELAKGFSRAKEADVKEILDSLYTLGRARPGDKKGTFVRCLTPP